MLSFVTYNIDGDEEDEKDWELGDEPERNIFSIFEDEIEDKLLLYKFVHWYVSIIFSAVFLYIEVFCCMKETVAFHFSSPLTLGYIQF